MFRGFRVPEPVEGSLSKGACFTSRKAAKEAQRTQRKLLICASRVSVVTVYSHGATKDK